MPTCSADLEPHRCSEARIIEGARSKGDDSGCTRSRFGELAQDIAASSHGRPDTKRGRPSSRDASPSCYSLGYLTLFVTHLYRWKAHQCLSERRRKLPRICLCSLTRLVRAVMDGRSNRQQRPPRLPNLNIHPSHPSPRADSSARPPSPSSLPPPFTSPAEPLLFG